MKGSFDRLLHERHLLLLLSEIVRSIPEKIAFKGGTCAMLFYDLPRFSFDLDFDILKPLEKNEIDEIRSMLLQKGKILDMEDKEYTLFFLFDYAKDHQNIKIEMNKRIWNNNVYKNVWFMGLPLMIPDEKTLFTNKLVALTDRRSPVARDLFDVWFFLKQKFPVHEPLIEERTGKRMKEYLEGLIGFIKKTYTKRNVLQGLGYALDEKQKDWARVKFIDDTLKELKARIE